MDTVLVIDKSDIRTLTIAILISIGEVVQFSFLDFILGLMTSCNSKPS